AVLSHGIQVIQFNLSSAGLPSLPDSVPQQIGTEIANAAAKRHIRIAALSATYNMIDPNVEERAKGLRRLLNLIPFARQMSIPMMTLCTGTRDPQNMWRKHRDNSTKEAWSDLLAAMERAALVAQENNVLLGIEPELSNVIDSAPKARRLLDELQSPAVRIVMDGSNLLSIAQIAEMKSILESAFDLLGEDIRLVHAKDLMPGGAESHGAAGTGVLDYDLYLELIQRVGYKRPLILHTLHESEVDGSVAFLRSKLNKS
ncbi:MAG TPA: sugar phosphate isomerase/epimerase family protein, partial [Anaerolineae bacterium]